MKAAHSTILTALVAGIVAASATTPLAFAAPTGQGTYIVAFKAGSDTAAEARNARATGAQVKASYTHALNAIVVNADPTAIEALRRNPNVSFIEAEAPVRADATQSSATWGIDRIDQRALPLSGSYNYPADGSGVNVYVIDTGLYAAHSEFAGRVGTGYGAISDGQGTNDCNGHGTHVSGTIAGTTYGVAKAATIIPVRVLDCNGSGTNTSVVAGLDWVVANHAAGVAAVANMSLGGGASTAIDTAVSNVISDGVTVVVAAGNSKADACKSSPARVPAAVTVAASDSSDRQASFSNYGKCVDLYAPGVNITSAGISSTSSTATMSGTSMASPHTAGVAAVLLSQNTALTPAGVASTLTADATSAVIAGATTGTPNLLLYLNQGGDTVTTPPPSTQTAPAVPTNVTAKAGKRSATVQWNQGSDGGSVLTSQSVCAYTATTKVGCVSISGSVTSVTITGLSAGVGYSFTVSATNAIGSSAESAKSNTVIPTR